MRSTPCLLAVAALALVALAPAPARADEIDELAKRLNIRTRWRGYPAKFHHLTRTFTFQTPAGPVKRTWRIVMDGPRFVAVIPDDHIQLLGPTVGTVPTSYAGPSRYLLDAFRGPAMPTQALLPRFVEYRGDGSSNIIRTDSFGAGGTTLLLTRVQPSRSAEILKKYTFSVHEQLGYMITGEITITFRRPNPKVQQFTTEFECSGAFQPWPDQWVYDGTVLTPAGAKDVVGYSNNTAAMARLAAATADGGPDAPAPLTLRNGGFVAWLHHRNSWSPCRSFSFQGADANMTLDPRTNTLKLTAEIPPEYNNDPNGYRQIWKCRERLFTLPPELAEHLRQNARSILPEGRALCLRIGQTEDFEDQPLPLTQPVRGLAWSRDANEPKLLTGRAAMGKKCLLIDGVPTVNVPWVAVQPDYQRVLLRADANYVIEAMMKVQDHATEDRRAYRNAYDAYARGLREEQVEPPDFEPLLPFAEAYIQARLTGTPASGVGILATHRTTRAKADNPAWQKVSAAFTAPECDCYLHLSFVCHSGTAMLDNLTVKRADSTAE